MASPQFPAENGPSNEEPERVALSDDDGRQLECYVEQSFELNDATYLLLRPVHAPVAIVAWDNLDDPEEAVLLEDDRELDRVFADARAVLAEQNLVLQRTAFTLTATGDLPPVQDEDILTLEIEPDGDEEIEPEEYQFLTGFYYQDEEYGVYTPVAPLLFFAKTTSRGQLQVLSPEEFREVQPVLEEWMFDDR